jgi:hypothetical protein
MNIAANENRRAQHPAAEGRTMTENPKDETLPQTQGEKEKPDKPAQDSKSQNKGDRP